MIVKIWSAFRFMILIAILGVVIFGFFACQRACNKPSDANALSPQRYQDVAPDKRTCPTVVQTSSRIYYVSKYTKEAGIITLNKYYTYDKKWTLSTIPLIMDPAIYGKVVLYER